MRYAFAHRGGRGHGRDNTIPTFAAALAAGATALETDAWVTADSIVVLDHDGLHRAGTPRERSITEISRAELAAHIPTLDELYDACGTDFDLAIDVKGEAGGAAICRVAESHDAADRLWLFAPSPARPDASGGAHAGVTVRGNELRASAHATTIARLKADGVEVVNCRWPYWRRSAVAAAHAQGLLAFAWDVQSSVALWRCKRLGVDGIFSDHIRILHAAT